MADRDLAGPPPKEAVDYLRRKGVRPAFDYREVWREEHSHAFTVANMMKLDLLADVRTSITKAQEEGKPVARWKEELAATLSKRGWWGRHPPPDPNDPKAVEKANLYISRRLETIWRVNTRQAAQAGVWERGHRSTSHPYVLYRVGPSKRHRDQHLAWDGLLLPKDADFWTVANPMNGWGCKCYTRFVTEAQYRRYVDQGIPEMATGDGVPARKPVKTEEPVLRPMQYRNKRTGEVHTGYVGIDYGFERNPGSAVPSSSARCSNGSSALWRPTRCRSAPRCPAAWTCRSPASSAPVSPTRSAPSKWSMGTATCRQSQYGETNQYSPAGYTTETPSNSAIGIG